jgi:hypothetical protein
MAHPVKLFSLNLNFYFINVPNTKITPVELSKGKCVDYVNVSIVRQSFYVHSDVQENMLRDLLHLYCPYTINQNSHHWVDY